MDCKSICCKSWTAKVAPNLKICLFLNVFDWFRELFHRKLNPLFDHSERLSIVIGVHVHVVDKLTFKLHSTQSVKTNIEQVSNGQKPIRKILCPWWPTNGHDTESLKWVPACKVPLAGTDFKPQFSYQQVFFIPTKPTPLPNYFFLNFVFSIIWRLEINCVFHLMGGAIMDALRPADICWQLQSVRKIWSQTGALQKRTRGSSLSKLLGTQFL